MDFDIVNDSATTFGIDVSAHKRIVGNLFLGVGIESQLTTSINYGNKDGAIVIDLYPSLEYEITPDLSINTSIGYTFGTVGNITFTGKSTSIGADYSLSESYGIGIKYKKYDIDYATTLGDIPDTLTATTISFNQKF